MADSSGLLNLEGKGVPDLFLVSSISLLVFLIAEFGFAGFRNGNLGLIVTGLLFLITLISYIALSERVIVSEGHILDGALGFTIGFLVLNLTSIFGAIPFSFLSTATESYLSGILASGQTYVIPIVNIIFAPIGETFLIFGLTAGIHQLVERTRLADNPSWQQVIFIGLIPSLIFGGLHGARSIGFLAMAFTINMLWTATLVYGEAGKIDTKWIPVGLGFIAGLHVGFNSSQFSGGIIGFLGLMVEALGTPYNRASIAILGFFTIMILGAAVRAYLILKEQEVI